MENSRLTPSLIVAASLIASSLIMFYGMAQLGKSIEAAGVHASDISLDAGHRTKPIRVLLDDGSELQVREET